MKEIVFILSSLNDSHYQKRVEAFIAAGYRVEVYGFKRVNQSLSPLPYHYTILGEISSRNYSSRLKIFYQSIKSIANKCRGKICFYSSLDIALFATRLIKAPYIYEVCDLTELCISNRVLRNILVSQNKRIIKNSLQTILTSQGFADFFNDIAVDKYYLLENKVSTNCPELKISRNPNFNKLRIGFVGVIRFESTYHFVKSCLENSKNIEIHLYGIYSDADIYSKKVKQLQEENSDRIYFHGRFSNPKDLPQIYSEIDLVLSAYPPTPGVIHAEPNKLYEALYFKCPIIVSKYTFLGRKVKKLGVGFVIDSMNEEEISNFCNSLNEKSYYDAYAACKAIDKSMLIEDYTDFFKTLECLSNKQA